MPGGGLFVLSDCLGEFGAKLNVPDARLGLRSLYLDFAIDESRRFRDGDCPCRFAVQFPHGEVTVFQSRRFPEPQGAVGSDGYIKAANLGVLVEQPVEVTAESASGLLWWIVGAFLLVLLFLLLLLARRRRPQEQ